MNSSGDFLAANDAFGLAVDRWTANPTGYGWSAVQRAYNRLVAMGARPWQEIPDPLTDQKVSS